MFKHRGAQWQPSPRMIQCVNNNSTLLCRLHACIYLNLAFHSFVDFGHDIHPDLSKLFERCVSAKRFVRLGWNAIRNNGAVPCGCHIENPKHMGMRLRNVDRPSRMFQNVPVYRISNEMLTVKVSSQPSVFLF